MLLPPRGTPSDITSPPFALTRHSELAGSDGGSIVHSAALVSGALGLGISAHLCLPQPVPSSRLPQLPQPPQTLAAMLLCTFHAVGVQKLQLGGCWGDGLFMPPFLFLYGDGGRSSCVFELLMIYFGKLALCSHW